MLTPPVFLLLAGMQFAVGALVAACCLSWTLLLWTAAIGSVLCAFFLSRRLDAGSDLSSDLDLVPTGSDKRTLQITAKDGEPPALPGDQAYSNLFGSLLDPHFDFNDLKRALPGAALILFLCLAPALGFTYANWRFPRVSNINLAQFAGKHVFLHAMVETVLPLKNKGQARFICTAQSVRFENRGVIADRKCDGATLLLLKRGSPFVGKLTKKAFFTGACTVTSVAELKKRGSSGYASYLKRIGINSLCYLDGGQNALVLQEAKVDSSAGSVAVSVTDKINEAVESLRGRLIAAHIHNLGQKVGSLLTAMVLGEKAVGLDPELLASFRSVGLSHVLAASGFNLTVVTLATHWACRALCLPAIGTNCMSFAMMIVFVLFAGNSASVVRASVMCALAIACSCSARRVHIAGLLGATLLISVLIDPLAVADPGFQLSYAAVGGIIFIVSPVAVYLETVIQRRWLRWSIDCLFTVLVAQACVLPLQLFYFKQIGLLFLPANLLASLVVTPVTVAGFGSSLVVLLCPFGTVFAPPFLWLAGVLDFLAALPLNVLVLFVLSLSSCRWAVLSVSPVAVWQVILYYLALVWLSVTLLNHLKARESENSQSLKAEEQNI